MANTNQGVKTSGKKGLVCVGSIVNADGSDWGERDPECPDRIIAPTIEIPTPKGLMQAKSGLLLPMSEDGTAWLLPDIPTLRGKGGVEFPIVVEDGKCYVDLAGLAADGSAAKILNRCLNTTHEQNEDCDYELEFTADCYDRRNAQRRIDQDMMLGAQATIDSGKSDPIVVCNEGKKPAFVQCTFNFDQFIRHFGPGFSAVNWNTTTYIGGTVNTESGSAVSAATDNFIQNQSRFRNASIFLDPGECADVCFSTSYTHVAGEPVNIGNIRTVIGCNIFGLAGCSDLGPLVNEPGPGG